MPSAASGKNFPAHDAADPRFKGRRVQPLTIRLNHWMNVLFIVLMAGSGLEIFAAYPSLGPQGAKYGWYPWQGVAPPAWLTIRRMAGRRAALALRDCLVPDAERRHLSGVFFRPRRVASPAFSAGSRRAQRVSDVRLLSARAKDPAARRFLQRPAAFRLQLRGHSSIVAASAVRTGYLQAGATPLADCRYSAATTAARVIHLLGLCLSRCSLPTISCWSRCIRASCSAMITGGKRG